MRTDSIARYPDLAGRRCSCRAAARASAPRSSPSSRRKAAAWRSSTSRMRRRSALVDTSRRRRARYLRCDVRDIAALQAAIAEAAASFGPVRVLVNNAARDDRHAIDDVTPEYWDENLAVNLRHHFFAAQAVAPAWRPPAAARSSTSDRWRGCAGARISPRTRPRRRRSRGLTRVLARELGEKNIRVNSIVPGAVVTERQLALWATPDGRAALRRRSSASSSACRWTTWRARRCSSPPTRRARSPGRASSSTPGSRKRATCRSVTAELAGKRQWRKSGCRKVVKAYGDQPGDPRDRSCDRFRRVRRLRRPVGLRQVDAAAHDRGPRRDHGGRDRHRRHGRQRAAAARARHRDGVPGLRAVSAQDRVREHGVRAAPAQAPRARDPARASPRPRASCRSPICSTASRASCRAASGSASRWAARSCASRRRSCSTSRCRNLDALLRAEMRVEIKKLHQKLGNTIIYVTHDQVEAMTLADRIVVLQAGNLIQYDTPDAHLQPAGREVRRRLHRLAADEFPAVPRRRGRAHAASAGRRRSSGSGSARRRMRAPRGTRVDVRPAARAHQRRRVGRARGRTGRGTGDAGRAAGLGHARAHQARARARTPAR